jgi:predicted O-methyltransferase YrrM
MNFNQIADESRASIESEDLRILLPIVAEIAPKNILEIGTWRGYSARTWLDAFSPSKFYTIECDEGAVTDEAMGIKGCNSFYATADSHDVQTLEEVAQFFGEEKIDFLFIDGDHSDRGVSQDFAFYAPLVRTGGIIALHDVMHYNENPEVNVRPLWEALKKQYKYVEIRVGKNSTGMGIIYV